MRSTSAVIKRFRSATTRTTPRRAGYPHLRPARRVGIIGGGPGGLSAAYYLSLMGHQVTVYEQRPKLGGMLRYGIPDYRLPQDGAGPRTSTIILSTGIEVHTGVSIGRDMSMRGYPERSYDAVYIAIGAHNDKKIGIEGEDAERASAPRCSCSATSARASVPDFTGKQRLRHRRRQRVYGCNPNRNPSGGREQSPASTAAAWTDMTALRRGDRGST